MTTKLLKTVAAHQLLHPKRRGAFGSGGIDRRPIEVHCGEVAEGNALSQSQNKRVLEIKTPSLAGIPNKDPLAECADAFVALAQLCFYAAAKNGEASGVFDLTQALELV